MLLKPTEGDWVWLRDKETFYPLTKKWRGMSWCSWAAVPNLFVTRDWFPGRQFFPWTGMVGESFGIIPAYYTYCALYFYYYYISSPRIIRHLIPEVGDPHSRALPNRLSAVCLIRFFQQGGAGSTGAVQLCGSRSRAQGPVQRLCTRPAATILNWASCTGSLLAAQADVSGSPFTLGTLVWSTRCAFAPGKEKAAGVWETWVAPAWPQLRSCLPFGPWSQASLERA